MMVYSEEEVEALKVQILGLQTQASMMKAALEEGSQIIDGLSKMLAAYVYERGSIVVSDRALETLPDEIELIAEQDHNAFGTRISVRIGDAGSGAEALPGL